MAPKILVTGVTGYIGGDAFYALYEAHPDFHYTLLVRSKDREEPVRKKYPDSKNVRIVYPGEAGSLTSVLEEEAKNADITQLDLPMTCPKRLPFSKAYELQAAQRITLRTGFTSAERPSCNG
ncbi:hypothetical protein VTK26DRAFT_3425 [Humicola hyalothermophila]